MNIFDAIYKSNGKFLTVTFIKKDGSVRIMNGRLGVKKYLSGGDSTLNASQYITFFDVKIMQYRAINKDKILSVRTNNLLIEKVK